MSVPLERIAKLLNQAENAGTEEESATFMEKAQQLATAHSIDLARARHATRQKERTTPVQRPITIGVKGTRGLKTLVSLMSGIARANDVKIDIWYDATCVVAYGYAEDIDVTEAMFASLSVQMAQAVTDYRERQAWRLEEVWDNNLLDYKPLPWLTARLSFQEGYAAIIADLLATAKDKTEGAAVESSSGTELVLVEKRKAVENYHRKFSDARGTFRGYSAHSPEAFDAGYEAGLDADLGSSTPIGGTRREIPA